MKEEKLTPESAVPNDDAIKEDEKKSKRSNAKPHNTVIAPECVKVEIAEKQGDEDDEDLPLVCFKTKTDKQKKGPSKRKGQFPKPRIPKEQENVKTIEETSDSPPNGKKRGPM